MPTLDLGSVVGPTGKQGEIGPPGKQGVQGDPGAPATINGVNALTITAGDNITLKQEGGNLEIGAEVPGKNLLINSDFRRPVNRNGKIVYTTPGYAIDMWFNENKLELTAEGVKSTVSTWWESVYQEISKNKYYLGKQLTLSVLIKAPVGSSVIIRVVDLNENTTVQTFVSETVTSADWILYYGTQTLIEFDASHKYVISICGNVLTESVEMDRYIKAIKLELGDHQTLARQNADGQWEIIDTIDYDTQYLLCSQYSPITGEWVGNQHSNPNLLDNWYFVGGGSQLGGGRFPINQQGKTEYSNEWQYTIDRWMVPGGSGLSIHAGYVSITAALDQIFENIAPGQYTASILTTEGLLCATATIPEGVSAETYVNLPGVGSFIFVPSTNSQWRFRIQPPNANYRNLIAAKLELGPVQTLAHKEGDTWVLNDPPPNKALELAKCQRYQVVFDSKLAQNTGVYGLLGTFVCLSANSLRHDLVLPQPMRARPTIRLEGSQGVRFIVCGPAIGEYTSSEPIPIAGICENHFSIDWSVPGVTPGMFGWVDLNSSPANKLIVDANL